MIFTANALLHPIAPVGTENVADYIGLDKNLCFDWQYIFDDFYKVLDKAKSRNLKFLKEKEDFFKRSQYQLDLLAKNNND